jgi:hypothetical protein
MLTYAVINSGCVYDLIFTNIPRHATIFNAELNFNPANEEPHSREKLLTFKDDDLVFICDIDERWSSWCDRQKFADSKWYYSSIEHPHFCNILERWIKFCLHKGASEGPTGLPNRMRQLAASESTPGLAMGSQA